MKYKLSSNIDALDYSNLPKHVAIIMDGNGRWAKKRTLKRIKGHEKGSRSVRDITRTCRKLGISVLTLYAFSTENWLRPAREVSGLMQILKRFLKSEQDEMMENNIQLNAIGEISRLPEDVQNSLNKSIELTKKNNGMILNLALSYGSRTELVSVVKKIATMVKEQSLEPNSVNEEFISSLLYTKDIPDPDLLIRTSGEMRISNFLLWQIAYSEIYFTDTLWPDFTSEEFIDILKNYQHRDRRFGKVSS